jgi:hypothetical protein
MKEELDAARKEISFSDGAKAELRDFLKQAIDGKMNPSEAEKMLVALDTPPKGEGPKGAGAKGAGTKNGGAKGGGAKGGAAKG